MLASIALGMVLEGDLTGYDIKKRIEKGIGVFYKASFGSLYPALKKLTRNGWLSTYFMNGFLRQWISLKEQILTWQRFISLITYPLKFVNVNY